MSIHRFDARADANRLELVHEAQKLGWWLIEIRRPVDYLGFHRGKWHPIEIKTADGKLTKAQELFIASSAFYGATESILIWRDIYDIIRDSQSV